MIVASAISVIAVLRACIFTVVSEMELHIVLFLCCVLLLQTFCHFSDGITGKNLLRNKHIYASCRPISEN